MCWLPGGQGYTRDTHDHNKSVKRAILIFKVLVKSVWVWQQVIDPVAPVQSYPGVISIRQMCLENIRRVFPLTSLDQSNNSLAHITTTALLRGRIATYVGLCPVFAYLSDGSVNRFKQVVWHQQHGFTDVTPVDTMLSLVDPSRPTKWKIGSRQCEFTLIIQVTVFILL